jgi:glycosyltransferase involved in cell wall biosynthesis
VATYLLINYEYPPLGGGAATASKSLAVALTRRGNRVIVLTSGLPKVDPGVWRLEFGVRRLAGAPDEPRPTGGSDEPRPTDLRDESHPSDGLDEEGVTVIRVPAWRKSVHRSGIIQMTAYLLSAWRRAPRVAREYQVERVLAFFSIPGGVVARWVHWRLGTPYAVSLRGGDVPGTEPNLRFFYALLTGLRRNVLRHARYICAPSKALKKSSEAADPFSVRVIPNGVDTGYFRPGTTPGPSSLTLLYVGRLHAPQKKVAVLLLILRAIRDRYGIPAEARIIGDGPERRTLENLARQQGLDNAVSFDGWLPREAVAAAYRSAAFLIHLSTYEGMSNVVLEALASGLPVVASRIPANAELIDPGKNGLLVEVNEDPSRIAEAIVAVFKNPDRWKQMSSEARAGVATKYEWDRLAASFEAGWS